MLSKISKTLKKSKKQSPGPKKSRSVSASRSPSKASAAASRSPSKAAAAAESVLIKKMSPKTANLYKIFKNKKFHEKVIEINQHLKKFDDAIDKIDQINGAKMTPQLEEERNTLLENKLLLLTGLSELTNQYTKTLKRNMPKRGGGKRAKTLKRKRI